MFFFFSTLLWDKPLFFLTLFINNSKKNKRASWIKLNFFLLSKNSLILKLDDFLIISLFFLWGL
jgi:hypothetical protein